MEATQAIIIWVSCSHLSCPRRSALAHHCCTGGGLPPACVVNLGAARHLQAHAVHTIRSVSTIKQYVDIYGGALCFDRCRASACVGSNAIRSCCL